MQREQVQSLLGELRSSMPCGQKTKTKNRSNIVTHSIKTLKMVHIKKTKKNLKKKLRMRDKFLVLLEHISPGNQMPIFF